MEEAKTKRTRSHWWRLPLSLLLLLAVAEIVLRFAWQPPKQIEHVREQGPLYVVESQQNGVETYVTAGLDQLQPGQPLDPRSLAAARFAMPKPKDTIRIFIIGSSPIYGGSDLTQYNLSSYLERDLLQARPDLQIEVINSAAQQLDTKILTHIVAEVGRFDPDFVLIYVLGAVPYLEGPANADVIGANPIIFAIATFVDRLRLTALLGPTTRRAIGDSFLALNNLVQGKHEEIDDLGNIRKMSEKELTDAFADLMAAATKLPGHVAFYEIASNLAGTAPLLSIHGRGFDPAKMADFAQALAQARNADAVQAKIAAESAIALDPDYAESYYLLGQALLRLQQVDAAYDAFTKARDLDASHERLYNEPAQIIEKAVKDAGLPWLETQKLFRSYAIQGVPGDDLFRDVTHPTELGEALLGRVGAEWILSQLPPDKPAQPLSPPAPIFMATPSGQPLGLPPVDPNGKPMGPPPNPGNPPPLPGFAPPNPDDKPE